MPISASELEEWIREHGPHLYHSTRDSRSRQAILREGIRPPRQCEGSRCNADEPYLRPRPAHVYLGSLEVLRSTEAGCDLGSDRLLAVDLRLLDPQMLNPDEDGVAARRSGIRAEDWGLPCPRRTVQDPWEASQSESEEQGEERLYQSYGEWAEACRLGEQPGLTLLVLQRYGALAVRGGVPAHACQAVRLDHPDEEDAEEFAHLPLAGSLPG